MKHIDGAGKSIDGGKEDGLDESPTLKGNLALKNQTSD